MNALLLAAAISLESVVWAVFYLLCAAAIFGILFAVVAYCEKEFAGAGIFFKFLRIFLVVAAAFVLIFIILAFMGHPVIRF
jgi:hypothetical protein